MLLAALTVGSVLLFSTAPPAQTIAPVFTIIPVSSATPTLAANLPTPSATPTYPFIEDGISIGAIVQITGTGISGLRLREGPGTTYTSRFIGMEEEVFEVKDGPEFGDGFTWWFLEAPFDSSRSGWAAGEFLSVIPVNE